MIGGVGAGDEVLGLEAARARWSELIDSAAHGGVTHLRDTESGAVARLVPRDRSPVPIEELPAWAVTAARPKLGNLVRQAAAGQPVALTRRGELAAVLAPAPGAAGPATSSGLDDLLDTLTSAAPQAPPPRCRPASHRWTTCSAADCAPVNWRSSPARPAPARPPWPWERRAPPP
ncbi:hypothetical protein CAG99_00010 [Streptomyces marincola]|uniref:Antitoxin n=1 Tax=Streptomyces marincola TaxID=2878388 RepID=A0A1W7CSR7_9ACTN|nr:hypothetical protein CAG99_00010 [Streptomyces marincola]